MKPGTSGTPDHVAVIGDIHGEDAALHTILRFLHATARFDAILCTGDVPDERGGGTAADRCCELLAKYEVLAVRGNHDRWYCEKRGMSAGSGDDTAPMSDEGNHFLASLPPTLRFETSRGTLLLCHGLGTDDMAGIYPGGDDDAIAHTLRVKELDSYRFIVAGHTHERMARRTGATTLINPGSLCSDNSPGFFTLDFPAGTALWHRVLPSTQAITKGETLAL